MDGVKPRLIPVLLIVSALASALVGCGGGDEESTSTPSAGSASGATTTQTNPAAPAGDAAEHGVGEVHRGGEASIEEFGSEAEGSEREAVLAVFTGYLNAIAEEDYPAACSHLAATVRSSLTQLAGEASRSACAALLPKLLAPTAPRIAHEQANGRITKVRAEGDRAFVVFRAPGAELYQLTMIEEGGEWKATTVGASVLVPELERRLDL